MTRALTQISALRETVAAWRAAGDALALVPTMGALHAGHMTLVEAARKQAKRVVVSIFVNPTQFGPNEDFNRYPRPLEADLALLRAAGVDAAWLPTVEEMYPDGPAITVHAAADISDVLDGAHRPGHFDGVATVVSKLLLQATPDVALFGEKDYQQLCVIKQLVTDLNINTTILGVPTVRETDGLALSSRNQYLSTEERKIAPVLHATLRKLAGELKKAQTVTPGLPRGPATQESGIPALGRDDNLGPLIARAKKQLLEAGFRKIDYLELRGEDTLAAMDTYDRPARVLVAAWLGTTRLIDNMKVE